MNKKKRNGNQVEGLLDVARQSTGPGVRSPLYRWMFKRHDQLLAGLKRPSWEAVAGFLKDEGIIGGNGMPATAHVARLTWAKVRADVKKSVEKTAARKEDQLVATLAGIEILTPPSANRTSLPTQNEVTSVRPKIDFRPAIARDPAPASGDGSTQSTPAASQGAMPAEQVDEKLRTVLEGLGGSSKTRMPRRVE